MLHRALAVVLVVVLSGPSAVNAVGVGIEAETSPLLQPRGSIFIDREVGPTGFVLGHDPVTGEPVHNTAMGVRGGSGTADDPYVISNWMVAHTDTFGVKLDGTDAHVRITNVTVPGEGNVVATSGITLQGASNVTLQDIFVRGIAFGGPNLLELIDTRNVRVSSAWLGGLSDVDPKADVFDRAIHAERATNTTMTNVTIPGNTALPGVFEEVEDIDIRQSTVLNNPGDGITQFRIDASENITIEGSEFFGVEVAVGAAAGFVDEGAENLTVRGNLFNGTKVVDPLNSVFGSRIAYNGLNAGSVSGSLVCGNAFESYRQGSLILTGEDLEARGNAFLAEAGEPTLGDGASVIRNAFGSMKGVFLGGGSESEVRNNSFSNTVDVNKIYRPTDVSWNWWDDPEGPNVEGESVFSEDGDPVRLDSWFDVDDMDWRPFLDSPPTVGPEAVDCGDPSTAGAQRAPPMVLATHTSVEAGLEANLSADTKMDVKLNEKIGPLHAKEKLKLDAGHHEVDVTAESSKGAGTTSPDLNEETPRVSDRSAWEIIPAES